MVGVCADVMDLNLEALLNAHAHRVDLNGRLG
jgi:hypothetical protein